MRVYISGPMSGCEYLNRPAFNRAEDRIKKQSHFVINPHNLNSKFASVKEIDASFEALYDIENKTRYGASTDITQARQDAANLARCLMDIDLAAVRSCDAIYLLKGWRRSRGARKELQEAIKYNKIILEEEAGDYCK